MHIAWKILAIIYGFGFLLSCTSYGVMYFYPGALFNFFILTPILLPFSVVMFWQFAIPYFAVTLGLLYWWETRKKRRVDVENVV